MVNLVVKTVKDCYMWYDRNYIWVCHVHSHAKNSIKDCDLIGATTSWSITSSYAYVKPSETDETPHTMCQVYQTNLWQQW